MSMNNASKEKDGVISEHKVRCQQSVTTGLLHILAMATTFFHGILYEPQERRPVPTHLFLVVREDNLT